MSKISPSTDPGNFSYAPVRSIAEQIDALANRLPATQEALRADPTLTPQARDLELAKWARKKDDVLHALFGRATDAIEKREDEVQAEIEAPYRKVLMSHAEEQELRSVLRELPGDERRKVTLREIQAGNARLMRALQADPSGFVTGLGPDFGVEAKARWANHHNPEQVKELASLALDAQRLEFAASALKKAFSEAAAAGEAPAEAARKRQEALAK